MNNFIEIAYLISAGAFIYGLKMLSHPRTARNGNIIASIGMLIAIISAIFISICEILLIKNKKFINKTNKAIPTKNFTYFIL